MSEAWFVVEPERWSETHVTLTDDEAHHAASVVRVRPPDVITVTDTRGTVARCAVESISDGRVVAEILERDLKRRARPEVVVYQGVAKGTKLDEVVHRLAELGVAELWVYESARAVSRWDARKQERVGERWRTIARSALKQTRNPHIMKTGAGLSWTQLVRRVANEPAAVVLWENASLPLRTALVDGVDRIALLVGPEGGLERSEVEDLADAGAQVASLGPLILRTELAPVVAATSVLFHYGLIG